jgi:archaellum biogenesis ATPase FlaH
LSDPDVFAITNSIVNHKFFDPEFRSSVLFVKEYFDEKHVLPSVDQIFAETGLQLKTFKLSKDQCEYCVEEIEIFCKQKAMELATLQLPDLIHQENYGAAEKLIKEAVELSIHRSTGVGLFDDPMAIIEMIEQQPGFSTGYKIFDSYLSEGMKKKELYLFTANSGGGKSIVKFNVGINLCKQNLNVLIISLELPVEMIYQRIASVLTGISPRQLVANKQEASIKIKALKERMGEMIIEYMPIGTDANEIRSFLKELEIRRKFKPDVIIVDYLDLMGSTEKISSENMFAKDKVVAEEFRKILFEYNLIGITSSQQNRAGINNDKPDQSVIQGGISKTNTVDYQISIVFNELQRQQGIMMFHMTKTRSSDGMGKSVPLRWDPRCLKITEADSSVLDAMDQNIEKKAANNEQRSKLLSQFGGM